MSNNESYAHAAVRTVTWIEKSLFRITMFLTGM